MTSPTLDAEPACPEAAAQTGVASARRLQAVRRPFGTLDRRTWERLGSENPWATPFARWAVHRAWWDAYGANAHDETLVLVAAEAADDPSAPPVGIVPLMHRHEVEPDDAARRTILRHGSLAALTPVPPSAKAIFMGASYHADYATVLAAPDDLPAVAEAVVDYLAGSSAATVDRIPWDVVDLRRLRCADPATEALALAFGRREMAEGWTSTVEREDVCPVVALPEEGGFEALLARLDKKDRHEIRRKVRRAEGVGRVRLVDAADPLAELDAFVELHQRRWGADGLFPPTEGGRQSRRFLERLFELAWPEGWVCLSFLEVGGRRIGAGITLDDGTTVYYYNAGFDPEAAALSPGVLLAERLIRRAVELGRRRFDFLRGNEAYKYAWGAVDEPIARLLVRRTIGGAGEGESARSAAVAARAR